MTDNSPPNKLERNLAEFTVSELAQAVKRTLEGTFEWVRLRGEVSRPNYHGSGHLYFTLKDEGAVIDGVAWRGTVGRLGLKLEEGMEVVCTGRVSSYAKSSKYQIVVEAVELAGEGALLKLLEARRKMLAAEGLFDSERKKALPFLPEVIGVVTSPTGAVIRDILHRLADRFPRHVVLWPVRVQGEGAADEVAAAIEGFNRIAAGDAAPRPDVVIVARGGGSLEDLMVFNEEVVVRAAAASGIPLISAVGHETDTTLIDLAADRRAPTPSAAAEMAVPVRAELLIQIIDNSRRMVGAIDRLIEERRVRVEGLGRGLPEPLHLLEHAYQILDGTADRFQIGVGNYLGGRGAEVARLSAGLRHPHERLALAAQNFKEGTARLAQAMATALRDKHARFGGLDAAARLQGATARAVRDAATRLQGAAQMLNGLSYQRVLERGFVLVRDGNDEPVLAAAATSPEMALKLQFHDGEVGAEVTGGKPKPKSKHKPRAAGKPPEGSDQGTLL